MNVDKAAGNDDRQFIEKLVKVRRPHTILKYWEKLFMFSNILVLKIILFCKLVLFELSFTLFNIKNFIQLSKIVKRS